MYEFVCNAINTNIYSSLVQYIWKHTESGTYYISHDYKEIIPPQIDTMYMLMYINKTYVYSNNRLTISNDAKKLSENDLLMGQVEYYKSIWKFQL